MVGLASALVVFVKPMANNATVATIANLTKEVVLTATLMEGMAAQQIALTLTVMEGMAARYSQLGVVPTEVTAGASTSTSRVDAHVVMAGTVEQYLLVLAAMLMEETEAMAIRAMDSAALMEA